MLASTGKDWEAVGFAPTTQTKLDQAMDVATVRALRKIAVTAPPERAKSLLALAAVADARINPVKPALPLSAYAGTFGQRSLVVEDQKLVYKGPTGHKF